MDIRKVKKLIELMEESYLAEIEVKEGEDSVRISRAKTPTSSWVKADDSRLKEINSSQTRSGGGLPSMRLWLDLSTAPYHQAPHHSLKLVTELRWAMFCVLLNR